MTKSAVNILVGIFVIVLAFACNNSIFASRNENDNWIMEVWSLEKSTAPGETITAFFTLERKASSAATGWKHDPLTMDITFGRGDNTESFGNISPPGYSGGGTESEVIWNWTANPGDIFIGSMEINISSLKQYEGDIQDLKNSSDINKPSSYSFGWANMWAYIHKAFSVDYNVRYIPGGEPYNNTSGANANSFTYPWCPINSATGEYYINPSIDLHLGGRPAVYLSRYHASSLNDGVSVGSALGENWMHNFDMRIAFPVGWGPVMVVAEKGKILTFWSIRLNPTEEYTLNFRQEPTPFKLRQDDGNHFWLMDPLKEQVYRFDAEGRLMDIFDRNENRLAITRETKSGLITQVADGLGRTMDFTYDGEDRLTQVSDGTRTVGYGYDTLSRLAEFTDAMGNQTTYANDGVVTPPLITAVTFPEDNIHYTQTFQDGKVVAQTDAYGNEADLSFDAPSTGNTTVIDPDGTQKVFTHEDERLGTAFQDETGNEYTFGYNDREQLTTVTDRFGDQTTYAYHDASGKIASMTNAKGDTVTYTYTPQNQTFTNPDTADQETFTFYDLTRVDYPDGTNELFTYDEKGNLLTHTDRTGKIFSYTTNDRGQVLTATNPSGGVTTITYNVDGTTASTTDSDTGVATYEYDELRRLNKINRSDGAIVRMTYDDNNRITSITDENGYTYTTEYDANGNLVRVTDPADNDTRNAYDLMDQVSQITDRLGKASTITYDNMNRLASFTDANGLTTTYGYDPRGWLTGLTVGGQTWLTAYDDERVVSSHTTPLGYSTDFQTDKLGHTTGITDPLSRTTTFARDSMGRITDVTDPLGRTTNYSYDARGLVSGVTLPAAGTASYTRNDMGLLSGITDLNGCNWTFGYTNMGRPQSSADPLGNTWQHTYDTRGRLDQTTYPDAATLTRTYDDAGNLTRGLYSGGPDLQYTYDGLDRLLTANGIAFTRDDEGRVTATDNPGTIFGATYDDGGRLSTATYNNGAFTVTYTYDSSTGLLSRVTDDLTNTQIDFSYDNDRRLTGITRSNGVNTTFTYDNAARLTRIQEGGIIDIQYTLDAAGQITREDMTVPLDPASVLAAETNTFAYDAASQVSSAGYAFDGRGRQTAAVGHTYTWDNASRLTGVDGVTLAYNGLSDLTSRTQGAAAIHYYYNYAIGLKPITAEKDEVTKQFLRYYVWTPGGRLLYMIDSANGNKAYFYHFNRTGSTLALTDSTGAVTDSYAYTPYGKLLQHSGSSEQPFTFVGKWGVKNEGESGNFYHMRARYYDAATARFVSREQLWPQALELLELNPYQYAKQNPLRFIDPQGTDGLDIVLLAESGVNWQIFTRKLAAAYNMESWDKLKWYEKIDVMARISDEISPEYAMDILRLMNLMKAEYNRVELLRAQVHASRKERLLGVTDSAEKTGSDWTTYIAVQNVGDTSAKMTTSFYSTSILESNRKSARKAATLESFPLENVAPALKDTISSCSLNAILTGFFATNPGETAVLLLLAQATAIN